MDKGPERVPFLLCLTVLPHVARLLAMASIEDGYYADRCPDCDGGYHCRCDAVAELPKVSETDHPIVFDSRRTEVFDPVRDMIDDLAPAHTPLSSLVREEFEVKGHVIYVWTIPASFFKTAANLDFIKAVTRQRFWVPQEDINPAFKVVYVNRDGSCYGPDGLKLGSKAVAMNWLVKKR